MKLTLLVENNPQIESFYQLNLSTWLGLETVTQNKALDAMKYLESNKDSINLIICRSKMGKESTAKILLDYAQKVGLTVPVLIIGPGTDFTPEIHIPNSLDIKHLIKTSAGALNITAKEMMTKVVPDFFPIPLRYFESLKRSICPVYVKNDDDQYSVVFYTNKDFSLETLGQMKKDGKEFLYVDKMDRLSFVSNVTAEVVSTLVMTDLSDDEQLSAADQNLDLLSKKLLSLGVTEETVALANKNIENIKNNVKRHPKISKLLERLLSNKSSYLFKHTQILTYVALHIVRNIDWGTPEQEDKISFICFFHDIALTNDVQCQIKSTNELRQANFSTDDKALVEKHAQIAAEYVQKFPHAPMGSDQIIRQHHGQLNGVGFSDHFGANVSPMSIVFIVAEEFTRLIMDSEGSKLDKEGLIKSLKEVFPTSRFSKMIEKLESLSF